MLWTMQTVGRTMHGLYSYGLPPHGITIRRLSPRFAPPKQTDPVPIIFRCHKATLRPA